ncbi:MAG: hypothetical protein A2126_00645 [Candidatus Woykebacteria bacterium GWB1_45_5]|uniref:Aminoglycoside phosphotransferase domain-containing protein n=2 Tax=Candidatus Woykeibacteriota TaxID=1817899 RepID=A0A1G1W2L6_9BACT|nr:MAG: hypothetical protein A2113_00925 [Candidatus Woykebacteria bacterium GWA1_44_8]OGY24228.1 MAG: hypothetical protein A2126_00645 [Candidatus Woykebacteria bacterium GWB1_45_5]
MPEASLETDPTTPLETHEIAKNQIPVSKEPPERPKEEKEPFKIERQEFANKATSLLEEKKFYFDRDEFDRQIADEGRRYLTLRGMMMPEEKDRLPYDRFFKAPLPQKDSERENKVKETFRRQVLAHDFLDGHTDFPVSEVIEFNTDATNGPMYAIMAAYQEGSGVGFLNKPEDAEKLNERHAQLVVRAIRELAHQEKEIKPELAEVLEKRPAYQNYEGFLRNIADILDKQVNGAGEFYSEDKKPLHQILENRTGILDFREKSLQLVQRLQPTIEKAQQGIHLVHGDLAPNNLFLGDGVEALELMALDFEYLGISGNEVLAAVYDLGNLRARSWNNEAFRNALDREMIESYKADGQEEVGKTIVALGTLRSHMNLAGFFENYKPEKSSQPIQKERRELTEKDIAKAWKVAGEI